jgi:hypothetical protein
LLRRNGNILALTLVLGNNSSSITQSSVSLLRLNRMPFFDHE